MTNVDIEAQLEQLPDLVANALEEWRTQTLNRERLEALLYAELKADNPSRTATDIKAAINASEKRFQAVLNEIKAEADYTRLYERLLSAKKKASLRTAY